MSFKFLPCLLDMVVEVYVVLRLCVSCYDVSRNRRRNCLIYQDIVIVDA